MTGRQMKLGGYLLGIAGMPIACCAWASQPSAPENRYSPYPGVREINEGVLWPEGQALPTFATPAATLDAIEVQALSVDEQITFSALQGHVNRKRPRFYLLDARADERRDTWANTPTVALGARNLHGRDTKYDLVAKYAQEVDGVVLYDPEVSPHDRPAERVLKQPLRLRGRGPRRRRQARSS